MALETPEHLPPGFSPGVWEYTHSDRIADEYDEHFVDNLLFEFDEQVLARYLKTPGTVVDFGCGTGRALVGLARRGFQGLGVDFSPRMLDIVGRKAAVENLPIMRLRANLVELDCVDDDSADYGICLFSTLGMIQGRDNRRRVLEHARRIIKPGGLFVIHVHNLWYNLFDPFGRRWLADHLPRALLDGGMELGDKVLDYRGISGMYLHTFTKSQLCRDLREGRFEPRELIPLCGKRNRRLRLPWLFGRIRANGWIAVCE